VTQLKALPLVASLRLQEGELLGGFHALGNDPLLQAFPHADHGAHDGGVIRIRADLSLDAGSTTRRKYGESSSKCWRSVMRVTGRKGSRMLRSNLVRRWVLLGALCLASPATLAAQKPDDGGNESQKLLVPSRQGEDLSRAPGQINVNPVARDEEIHRRLQSVLKATGWYADPQVRVEEGVVFLDGRTKTDELKNWAGDLARHTQDVVAVVNRIEVLEPSVADLSPAWNGLWVLWHDFTRSLPFLGFALLILALSVGAGMLAKRGAQAFLRQWIRAKLLRNVIAGFCGVIVVLIGTYIVLRVSGLTQLALTVVGGTGLIGLAVGIAFREITENFLASIFLSMQRPFETGDLIEVAGTTGYVQQLNVRTTILMTLDGNLVQIPNATVYKSNLCNFTANANRREDFVVGIGYDDSINDAQEIALAVLTGHPAVLHDPEPLVLADSLGKATVNLRIYFWINGHEYSWLKVRSSVIRLVKRAFQEHGISMPDEAREVVFPQGIPVTMLEGRAQGAQVAREKPPAAESPAESSDVSTRAEAGLHSDAGVLKAQARQAKPLGENLLPSASDTSATDQK
jgi:small-conductance mechanosensitive channel